MNLTPFLLFPGNCAEAMTFYQSCLGGTLAITKLGDTPMAAHMPPEKHNKVTYSHLKSDALEFSATDWLHPVQQPLQGNTVAIFISGGKFSELKTIFDKLAVGSNPDLLDNLRDMPFGSYGHLADKFGVHWFFQGEKSGA